MARRLAELVLAAALGALLGTMVLALATSAAPTPALSQTSFSEALKPYTPQTTSVAANGVACTVPGGATCTTILSSTQTWAWNCITIWVKNTDAADALTNVLIEASPDGSSWEELVPSQFNGLAAGVLKDVSFCPAHYPYMRVEARSAADTTTSVWISGFRP